MPELHPARATAVPPVTGRHKFALAYVNLPFCERRCPFCCFVTDYGPDLLAHRELGEQYLEALHGEIDACIQALPRDSIALEAINLGGGTPTLFPPQALARIIEHLAAASHSTPAQVSIEATPASLDPATLETLREAGCNRLSIGVQTFADNHLHSLGRRETFSTIRETIAAARKTGFKNINLDLLYGFPGQTRAELEHDLETALTLEVEHLSPSPFLVLPGMGMEQAPPQQQLAEWSALVHSILESNGYPNYLHKYFSRPGQESITELIYYRQRPCLAFGAGVTSSFGTVPYNIRDYIANPQGTRPWEQPPPPVQAGRALQLGLLQPEGISVARFKRRFACSLPGDLDSPGFGSPLLRHILQEMQAEGSLQHKAGRMRIHPRRRFQGQAYRLYLSYA